MISLAGGTKRILMDGKEICQSKDEVALAGGGGRSMPALLWLTRPPPPMSTKPPNSFSPCFRAPATEVEVRRAQLECRQLLPLRLALFRLPLRARHASAEARTPVRRTTATAERWVCKAGCKLPCSVSLRPLPPTHAGGELLQQRLPLQPELWQPAGSAARRAERRSARCTFWRAAPPSGCGAAAGAAAGAAGAAGTAGAAGAGAAGAGAAAAGVAQAQQVLSAGGAPPPPAAKAAKRVAAVGAVCPPPSGWCLMCRRWRSGPSTA